MSVPETGPTYQSALRYYVEHAYGTALLWDWSGAPGGQQELTDLMLRAEQDEAFDDHLQTHCRARAHLFKPARELRAWEGLLRELARL